MKFILIVVIMLGSLGASQSDDKKKITEMEIQKQLEREKKYAKEQTFYMGSEYDLKGAEVNPESVKHTPSLEVDDLDMDSVYD